MHDMNGETKANDIPGFSTTRLAVNGMLCST